MAAGLRGAQPRCRGENLGDVINLHRARKSRQRETARAEAAENRVRFGRTKADRQAQAEELARQSRRFEEHALTEREEL